MYTQSYLFSRRGIFYFRIAISVRLRPALSGRTEFRCSLFTRDKKLLTKIWMLSIQSQNILNQVKKLLTAMKQDPKKMGFIVKNTPTDDY